MIGKAHQEINTIFLDVLPKHGMKPRQAQINLCHEMLDTMNGNSIALCDAGVGIGKTFSYLVAGVLLRKHKCSDNRPIVISTASIALQNAIYNEYIPFLSKVLVDEQIIEEPFQAVIRKGKAHYVCDRRLAQRIRKANLELKNAVQSEALFQAKTMLDLDTIPHISRFDKDQICVPDQCNCLSRICRYKDFVNQSKSTEYLFQICNHNFFIADAIHREDARPPLLPDYRAIVIDEAHKIPEAARQMFGKSLGISHMRELLLALKEDGIEIKGDKVRKSLKRLLADLQTIAFGESGAVPYTLHSERKQMLSIVLKVLNALNRAIVIKASDRTINELMEIIETLTLFQTQKKEYFYYAEKDDSGTPILRATLADMDERIKRVLWSLPEPMILTSGTLAVGKDFKSFRDEAAIKRLRRTVTESVASSPFDYQNNGLLYLPKRTGAQSDMTGLAHEIEKILAASHGHGLVLFTSYAEMAKVCEMLKSLPYPRFIMSKNRYNTIEQFKNSKNGVLFATGAVWEGVDFPGDIVSSLIIVRLPFPIPNPITDRRKSKYMSLQLFINNVILPSMQMKLKQGAGRAIRTETDTCVISVLDHRALMGRRYHDAVLSALPAMPTTDDLGAVKAFMRRVKDDGYFGGLV